MFHFIKSFLSAKSKQLGREIAEAIVSIDPEGATQAQIESMEQDLDRTGMILQRIRTDYEREVREADNASYRYAQLLAAADHLQARLVDPMISSHDKASITESLARLVSQIENFSKEVEQEKQDVQEVKVLLDETQAAYREKATILTQAKRDIDRTKRDMQRAVLQAEHSEEKARRVAEVAGLREGSTSKLLIATSAMERKAEEARVRASALNMKAELLASARENITNDPLVIEAIRTTECRQDVDVTSLQTRLTALREKWVK